MFWHSNSKPPLSHATIAGFLFAWVSVASSGCAHSQTTPNPQNNQRASELFVLGTTHLSSLGDSFQPSMLDGVVSSLTAYSPDAIAIEAAPGWTIEIMRMRPKMNSEALSSYVREQINLAVLAQRELGLDWPAADAALNDNNSACNRNPGTVECILVAAAAYEVQSAVLRWMYCDFDTRRQFEEHSPELATRLAELSESSNEYYALAARLAFALGHNRLYPIDDHLEKGMLKREGDNGAFSADEISEFWDKFGDAPFILEANQREQRAIESADLAPYYRWINKKTTSNADYALQFAPMDEGTVGRSGLIFRGYWEARNLRMASHIADRLASQQGKKMLVIIGSSHKKFLDGYFGLIHWVNVADADLILN